MSVRKGRGRRATAALGLALWLSNAPGSSADTDREAAPSLTVEAAHIRMTAGGEIGSVHFRLDNHGARDLVLLAVRSPLARESMLLMRQRGLGLVEVEALLVPRHETLDLGSRHLRAELRDLTRRFEPGETVPLALAFRGGEVRTDAHVHFDEETGGETSHEPANDVRGDALSRLDRSDGAGG